ncbi:ribonuclease E/G-like protein, chloroplastic isoform X3 [Arabidopsis lyrata subsp. lyrata]|uniref:ribonuclease E/G-like protein, chloroplastic isoform X3 n=1 Tax=Arabidopsis lyrata subsp. lyrata TaxID=81972 RepID=UPI000A29CBFC|nr:ribonuclease E/G-like protein, chloroplastic isoform X3 [Arabidopsis lyrata subsp. lyrata]XP_020886466.1 ribonuclease E/G-like protein, chloroplastic isoform X3 [Arabidopsis lyrata subsp. lyrata]|eukprot:XP_020886465.1 ribonuclease E/G-like protein, chloroplastic isoform X3 [Arabidopsis lyrata subsp. lyrata]
MIMNGKLKSRYNYFLKAGYGSSSDVIWRPGPQFSLSVPSSVNRERKVVIRDSWMSVSSRSQESYVWGSWIDDAYLFPNSVTSAQSEDEYTSDSAIEVPRTLLNDKQVGDESFFCDELAAFSSENSNLSALFSDNYQPIEEPWLIQDSITLQHARNMQTDSEQDVESCDENENSLLTVEQNHQLTETLLPDGGFFQPESISTTILINSSICTVQRIAVLEGEKLVELLLEPVKTNVQCDSVYLGVITKFVPHMGGAFVNIGSARHSFMDIKSNREPFIFPPFCDGSKKQAADGSPILSINDIPAPHEIEHASYDFEASSLLDIDSNDPGESFHDDDDEHENDEYHVSDALVGLVNGTVVNHGAVEVGSENGLIPLEREHSVDSLVSNPSVSKTSKAMPSKDNKWIQVRKGTKIIVQVVKEGLGTKGPTLTAYPKLRSRFWVLLTRCKRIGVSKKISGVERTRLKVIAKTLQPQGFGLTVRTVAAGHSLEELQKDLEGLLLTWKNITDEAKSSALAADEGVEGAIPALLHRAMGQTLSVVQDYFNDKVEKMVVDSPRTYHEVTHYLQDMAPDLCNRVELHDKGIPLFDLYDIEEEIEGILSKRVPLSNGGSLVIEQTEALVSIDVNGGHGMFGQGNSQEKAILEVNLAAGRQIAREIRLRDIGGIIVVDFIDMADESNKRLVYEEVKKAVERDRSLVKVSELSRHGLMEITRKRVRPSVTFMISEPCSCCHATGRVEALETSFSKIEQEICRQLAKMEKRGDLENPKSWPRFILRVDSHMSSFLTTGKRTRLAILSSSLKVWILLKVARHFTRGTFEVKPFMDEKTVNERQHQVAISLLKKADAIADSSGKKKLTLIPKKEKTSGKHRR